MIVLYLTFPRTIVNDKFLVQAYTLKHKNKRLYFTGCTREIPLPNPNLYVHKPTPLTFPSMTKEGEKENVPGDRLIRSRARRGEATSSQQPQPTTQPVTAGGWIQTAQGPVYTVFQPGWDQPPHPHEARCSG